MNCARFLALVATASFVFEVCWGAAVGAPPVLEIKQGKLKGRVGESRGGRHFAEFLGIPYVSKPERFELAKAGPVWKDVREAGVYGSKCLQYRRELKEIIGSEDCLFLNVFTPEFPKDNAIKPKSLLPVMVFIHGGSFLFYSGEVFNPKYLLDEDVILVTFNYRIGALGFLNTEDRSLVANLGMKDQVAALRWIQENIESFGGDAKRVTIFGNSAGSASVSYHVLSPLSKNLFSRAISQSGTALCPWAFVPNPRKVALTLGEKLGCGMVTAGSTKELVECLKKKTGKEIVEQQQKLLGSLSADPPVPFAPSPENLFVQTRSESTDDFLPDSPRNLFEQGAFNNVPYIIGVNSMDGLTFAAASILNSSKLVEQIDKNFNTIAPAILSFRATAENPVEEAKKIREFYFGKNKITAENQEQIEKFAQLLSDRNFFQCSQNTALMASKQNPVYLYYFSRDNGDSFLDHFGATSAQNITGVKHQDEIQYLTSSPYFPPIGKSSKHFTFSQNMVKLWTSFASDGKPNKLWGKSMAWPFVSAAEREEKSPLTYYYVDDDTKIGQVPFGARVKFWNSLPLNKKPASATIAQPVVIGETKKSPAPSPIAGGVGGNLKTPGMTQGGVVVGHTGASTHLPPIAATVPLKSGDPGQSGSGKESMAKVSSPNHSGVSGGSGILSTTGAGGSNPKVGEGKKNPIEMRTKSSASPIHSHVFPDHDDHRNPIQSSTGASVTVASSTTATSSSTASSSTSEAVSTTTTKKPGFLSRIIG